MCHTHWFACRLAAFRVRSASQLFPVFLVFYHRKPKRWQYLDKGIWKAFPVKNQIDIDIAAAADPDLKDGIFFTPYKADVGGAMYAVQLRDPCQMQPVAPNIRRAREPPPVSFASPQRGKEDDKQPAQAQATAITVVNSLIAQGALVEGTAVEMTPRTTTPTATATAIAAATETTAELTGA